MKVLMVITRGDTIGGAQRYVYSLADRLQRDQHEVLVVTGTLGTFTDMLADAGIATTLCDSLQRRIHPLNDLRAVRSLRRIICAFRPDLVSAHSSKAGILGRFASRLHGVPCVFTAHGWAFAEGVSQPGRTMWRLIERLTEPMAARIICVSACDQKLAVRHGFAPRRLATIHNGIPDTPLAPHVYRESRWPARIVMVARFSPQKDHQTLLRAIQAIPDCELDFVGDGPLEDQMKEYAARLGLRHRVHFHGYQSDVSAVLAAADVFVLASRYEGFPLSTLEAMRAGLPSVVSDVGGAGEAVVHGVTGYLVPARDVDALRACLQDLVDHRDRRSAMGEAARQRYLSSFTFDRMYRSTLAIYEETARNGNSRDVGRTASEDAKKSSELTPAASIRESTGVGRSLADTHGTEAPAIPVRPRHRRLWRSVWD